MPIKIPSFDDIFFKLIWLGYPKIKEISEESVDLIICWFEQNFYIHVKKSSLNQTCYTIYFKETPYVMITNLNTKKDLFYKLIPEILNLWKCVEGKLIGPDIKNFEEPEEWT